LEKRKQWLLLILILALSLTFWGCGLFNDIDLDDEGLEEITIAGFLNDFINEFEATVQAFIDEAEYDENLEQIVLPQHGEFDFSGLFAYIDYLRYWGEIPQEEELQEDFLCSFSSLLDYILENFDVDEQDLNDTDIQVDFRYKYYYEDIMLAENPVDLPTEGLLFVQAFAIRTIYIDEEKMEEIIVETFLDLAKYKDTYKIAYLYYNGLIGYPMGP